MLYFVIQIVLYAIFIAISKSQKPEKATSKNLVIATLIAIGSVVLSFLVEMPLRITALYLIQNKWLYIFVVLVVDLCKIVIPTCAIITMSNLFDNFKIVKIVLLVSTIAVIVSFAMNTYEALEYFKLQEQILSGQINFFTTITGGPISYNFGKIHLVVEFIPALLQAIVCLTHGDKATT